MRPHELLLSDGFHEARGRVPKWVDGTVSR